MFEDISRGEGSFNRRFNRRPCNRASTLTAETGITSAALHPPLPRQLLKARSSPRDVNLYRPTITPAWQVLFNNLKTVR